jgi:hypothetical protein
MGVNCSDVLAVRLWLDQKLQLRSPSNVVAGFDEGVGGTFFQLDSLQVMHLVAQSKAAAESKQRRRPLHSKLRLRAVLVWPLDCAAECNVAQCVVAGSHVSNSTELT